MYVYPLIEKSCHYYIGPQEIAIALASFRICWPCLHPSQLFVTNARQGASGRYIMFCFGFMWAGLNGT